LTPPHDKWRWLPAQPRG